MHGITIAVLGDGPEACDIARARAHAGHVVRLYGPRSEGLAAAVARIRDAAGLLPANERQRTLDGIVTTTDLDEAIAGAAVVIDTRR